jgi:hypothetical protein
MKAYIQTIEHNIPDEWLFAAMLGFKNKGFEIKLIEENDIQDLPCHERMVLVAYIEPTLNYFKLNDIVIPKPLNVPVELNNDEYLGRALRLTTMGEFKEVFRRLPINDLFVKPYDKVKAFASGVIDKVSTMELAYSDVADEELVQTSTLVDFVAEYRCFVYRGVLTSIHFYKGDLTVFPNIATIQQMIRAYTEAPVAYTLDVGVVHENGNWGLREAKTLLVECNDMWSVDNYGFNGRDYSTMLRDRWFEIIKNINESI